MKIINRQGKLFGLINIIDLGVIIILIATGYIFFNLARNAQIGYPLIIKVKVLFTGVPMEVVKKMQPWDREGRGSAQAKLLHFEIRAFYPQKDGQETGDIEAWLNLPVRVKDVLIGNRGEKTASFFYKGEELNLDDPLTFNTPHYSLQGTILNIDLMDREIEIILENNLPRELIDIIKVGDKVCRWQHLVGEVLAKEYAPNGQVKVKLHIKRGEVSIKVGEQFPFETEEYYVWGTIVKSKPWRQN